MKHVEEQQKIPCSVSLLTYNSADGLSACLESLREFAEIIVCDGNSTDDTRAIVKSHGVRVISQYDTDEPNTPCAMDKAACRERAMAAGTYAWRFFMDADDLLSPEAVDEIRTIVTDEHTAHFVWRMPTRVYIAGKEILHEATYPSYQTRLIHESAGFHFRGPVHDRLDFDAKKFSVGTMRHYYDFHWSSARVTNYWGYLGEYAKRERMVARYTTLGNFLYWGVYRRARIILGYLLWRLPYMYARYGFRDSMPLSIELTIVRYHLALLFGSTYDYVRTRVWCELLVETLRGKDFYRVLSNLSLRDEEAYGRVLDVGGGDGKASYWRYLRRTRWHRVVTLDGSHEAHPDVLHDLEHDPLPYADGHFDTVLLCNVLEHLNARTQVLSEIHRVLGPSGTLVCVVPFLVAVHPDPHDYVRLTNEGLEKILTHAGFTHVHIRPIGRGPLAASYYQSEFLLPRILKLVVLPLVLACDYMLLKLRPTYRDKFSLGYQFTARK